MPAQFIVKQNTRPREHPHALATLLSFANSFTLVCPVMMIPATDAVDNRVELACLKLSASPCISDLRRVAGLLGG
jgi:hypothetical protein